MTISVSDLDQHVIRRVKPPTVSLSRSKIFIFDDEAPADSPTVTILEMYPEAAATTSMVESAPGGEFEKKYTDSGNDVSS